VLATSTYFDPTEPWSRGDHKADETGIKDFSGGIGGIGGKIRVRPDRLRTLFGGKSASSRTTGLP
jgi:hypothetical protein